MARKPNQKPDDVASGQLAGGVRASGGKAGRRGREGEDLKIECGFENLSVTPREIVLLSHYLGAEIDEILRGED